MEVTMFPSNSSGKSAEGGAPAGASAQRIGRSNAAANARNRARSSKSKPKTV